MNVRLCFFAYSAIKDNQVNIYKTKMFIPIIPTYWVRHFGR